MTVKTKSTSMLSPALTGNILYYILCAALFQLSPASQNIHVLFFAGSALLWFFVGMYYGKRTPKPAVAKRFGFALLAMLPIVLFLAAYVVLTRMQTPIKGNPWVLFYSFGAPLLFWLKPAAFLLNYTTVAFPFFAAAYIGFLMFITFVSALVFTPKRIRVSAPASVSTVLEEEREPSLSVAETMQSAQGAAEPFEDEVVEEAVVLSQEEKEVAENEHKDILRFIAETDGTDGETNMQSAIEQQYEESQYRIDTNTDTYKTMPMPTIDELYAEVLRQKDTDADEEAMVYMQEIVTDIHFVAEYEYADESELAESEHIQAPSEPATQADNALAEATEQTDTDAEKPPTDAASNIDEGAKTSSAAPETSGTSENSLFSKFLHKKKED